METCAAAQMADIVKHRVATAEQGPGVCVVIEEITPFQIERRLGPLRLTHFNLAMSVSSNRKTSRHVQ
jgi:hypothetical protein